MEFERVDYAAWIGLDWGSDKHALCLQAADRSPVECCTLEQKPEVLHHWFMSLQARFDGRKVAVAIEQTRGAVIHFLLGLDFVHIFRIHPKSLNHYRLKPVGSFSTESRACGSSRWRIGGQYAASRGPGGK